MTSTSERLLTYLFLGVFSILVLVPVAGIALAALHPPDQELVGFGFPREIYLGNLERAWTVGRFGDYMRNSVVVAVTVTASVTAVSILGGYALGTMRLRGERAILILLLAGIIMPAEAMIIPLFHNLRGLGLTDTLSGVILPEVALFLGFGTFWMRAYFLAAPRALIEAARLDGASTLGVLWYVLLPMGRPAVLTMVLIVALWSWNAFLIPLVMISEESLRTAPLGLGFFQQQFETDIRGLAAASVFVALPVVAAYVVLQRHFIRGMLSGAVRE